MLSERSTLNKNNIILLLIVSSLAVLLIPLTGSLIFHVDSISIPHQSAPVSEQTSLSSPSYRILSPASQSSLSISANSGPAGNNIQIIGQGFPPGATIDLFWSTVNGSWIVQGHDFLGSKLVSTQQRLPSTQSDSSGQFNITIKVPYDYGGKHNIGAALRMANGSDSKVSAQAVYTLLPSFHISSTSGLPGTPITITATGLGWGLYSTDYHVLWDNNYAGYVTAITTSGNATFTITAVGAIGDHYIDIYEGYPGPAYLNIQQSPPSPQYYSPPLIPFHATFTITPSSSQTDQNLAGILAGVSLVTIFAGVIASAALTVLGKSPLRFTSKKIILAIVIVALIFAGTSIFLTSSPTSSALSGVESYVVQPQIDVTQAMKAFGVPLSNQSYATSLSATPSVVTVGSRLTISGSGFSPNTDLQIQWSTMVGSYLRGWNTTLRPLEKVTTNSQGSFVSNVTVPHDLEGIHEVKVANSSSNVGNAYVYIIRSAIISPTEGPAGTVIQINMTGVGWTFATNTATIVYDNSYVGYVCGFNSNGDVTAYVNAVGSSGIHTVDIYPTVYMGPNNTNAEYRYPLLDPQDHPAHSASFHFEFVITQQQSDSGLVSPRDVSVMTVIFGLAFLTVQSPIFARHATVIKTD